MIENISTPSLSSVTTPQKKNSKLPLVIVALLIVSLLIGSYFLSKKGSSEEKTVEVVSEEKEEKPTAKPTKVVKLNKDEIKIQVQNGTGTPGQAKAVLDLLVDADYVEGNITTGNADNSDYSKVTISYKEEFKQAVDDIKDILTEDFEDFDIDSIFLDSDDEYDVVIITGGKKFEDPTPTTSDTSEEDTTESTPSPTG